MTQQVTAPTASTLTTTRSPLRIDGERAHQPEGGADARRARRRRPGGVSRHPIREEGAHDHVLQGITWEHAARLRLPGRGGRRSTRGRHRTSRCAGSSARCRRSPTSRSSELVAAATTCSSSTIRTSPSPPSDGLLRAARRRRHDDAARRPRRRCPSGSVARVVRACGRPVRPGDRCRRPGRRVPARPPAGAAARTGTGCSSSPREGGCSGRTSRSTRSRACAPSRPTARSRSTPSPGGLPAPRTTRRGDWTCCAGSRDRVPDVVPAPGTRSRSAEALGASASRWAYAPLMFGYTNYCRAGLPAASAQVRRHPGRPARGRRLAARWRRHRRLGHSRGISTGDRAYAFWLDSPEVQEGVYYDAGGQPGNAVAWESDRLNDDSLDFFRGTRRDPRGCLGAAADVGYIELQNTALAAGDAGAASAS